MFNNKIKIYCLLLALLICTASTGLSVGNTYARYSNTVAVRTVLEAPSPEMESNCLAMKNAPPITVLLGDLSLEGANPTQISFSVKSAADAERSLVWAIKETGYADYITVKAVSGGSELTASNKLALKANEPAEITLTITPTSFAKTQIHEEIEINVAVSFGDLQGAFRVIVPEVTESSGSQSGSANSPETGEGENTGSEGETGEDIVTPIEPESPSEGETEPGTETETGDAGVTGEKTLLQTGITQNALSKITPSFTWINAPAAEAAADQEAEVSESTETGTETGESTESAENTEPSEGTESEEAEGSSPPEVESEDSSGENQYEAGSSESWLGSELKIETVKIFGQKQKLPAKLTRTGGTTAIKLGLDNGGTLAAFPDYTRFSFDNGASWYISSNGYIPLFAASEITGSLLLDFSNANLGEASSLVLAIEAFSGETSVGYSKTETAFAAMEPYKTAVLSESLPMQLAEESEAEAESETEEPSVSEQKSRILAAGESLEITFPAEWISQNGSGYSLEYTVDFLTLSINEPKELVYSRVIPSDEANSGISAIYTADAESGIHNLVIKAEETLTPLAGTYVVDLKWNYEGICFYETKITFFINYSAQTAFPSGS